MGINRELVTPFTYNSFCSSGKAFHLMLECCSSCGRDLLPFRHNDSQSAFQFISKVFSGLCPHQTLSKPFLHGLCFVHRRHYHTETEKVLRNYVCHSTKERKTVCWFHSSMCDFMHLLVKCVADLAQSVN